MNSVGHLQLLWQWAGSYKADFLFDRWLAPKRLALHMHWPFIGKHSIQHPGSSLDAINGLSNWWRDSARSADMAQIHLRIIDGSQRGRVFDDLQTPVTIGREEGNAIQLNDDRVSRYHVKIQEDHDRMLLTDLTSTNGTMVNGEEVQLRILRHGDIITIGRSVLLYGSRNQIAARLAVLRGEELPEEALDPDATSDALGNLVSLDFELGCGADNDLQATLHTLEPPMLPGRLDAVQAAELSELLEFLHIRLRRLIAAANMDSEEESISIDRQKWQDLLDLQSRLAEYMRTVGDPDSL